MSSGNELFKASHVILDSDAKTQKEAFEQLASLAKKLGYVDDEQKLIIGFENREKESTTGFEDGFAIPHARIAEVKKPAVLLIRFKSDVDWNAMDGQPTKVAIALIIPKNKSSDIHLSLLSKLSVKLLDAEVRKKLKSETSKIKIKNVLFNDLNKEEKKPAVVKKEQKVENKKEEKLILAITACATGIAHTFMAADKLTTTGPKLGYKVKVETHGSEGVRNDFTAEEIAKAEVIVIASDIGIELDRFEGKKVYSCPVAKAIKEPEVIINEALKNGQIYKNTSESKNKEFNIKKDKGGSSGQKTGVMKHLMSGVSYMVPVVILGGICIAFALGLSKAIYGSDYDLTGKTGNFLYYLNAIGTAAFTLMIPVLGAFIANSIAGRAALAPAFVVSFIGNTATDIYPLPGIGTVQTPMGFIGAIFIGLAIGYTVKWMNGWNVPKMMRPIMPIIIIPVLNGLFYALIVMFVIGAPIGWVMGKFSNWISNTWGNINNASSIAVGLGFGLLIGAMTGFDMGGPVNKIAFLTCSALVSPANGSIYTPMGAMACAIPVAPLGMGFATLFFRKYFDEEMKSMGIPALFMGTIGISEGAIPFAINDPKRVIPCNVISSAVAGGIAGVLGIAGLVAQGGPIVAFLGAMGKGNAANASVGWGGATGWILIALVIMIGAGLLNAFMYGGWLMIANRGKKIDKVSNEKNFSGKWVKPKVANKKI